MVGAGSYWISVLETDPATVVLGPSQWLWGDAATAGVRANRLSDGIDWTAELDIDHAFTLTGTPVPGPPALVLMAAGMLGYVFRAVRRRNSEYTGTPSRTIRNPGHVVAGR
jgi:hypothetical protein